MVSLENKSIYSERIAQNQKLTAFQNLLLKKVNPAFQQTATAESDEIFLGLSNAITSNDKAGFESFYNKKNKSHPTKESPSPFVNDDFLIFCIIVGVLKFRLDRSWIKSIISIRASNPTTTTFDSLINENFQSNSNVPELIVVSLNLLDESLITGTLLVKSIKSVNQNRTLFQSQDDFLILCSIRAYDIAIELKEGIEGSEITLLRKFNATFLKRIKYIALIMQTIILVAILYTAIILISIKPEIKIFFDKIGSVAKILGLVGLSQFGNFSPFIKQILYKALLVGIGYPKELLKKIRY